LEAERRAMKWVEFIYGQPDTRDQKLLPDNWQQTTNSDYVAWMRDAAKKTGVPLELLARHLYKESTFNPKAQNGAYKGMGQLGAGAVKAVGIKGKFDYFDAKSSIYASAAYLALLHRQMGSWPSTIAAYNAGRTRVDAWLRNQATPYEPKDETKEAIRPVFRGDPNAFDN
jgi:soluble lytic murein transglycosylase-like protein